MELWEWNLHIGVVSLHFLISFNFLMLSVILEIVLNSEFDRDMQRIFVVNLRLILSNSCLPLNRKEVLMVPRRHPSVALPCIFSPFHQVHDPRLPVVKVKMDIYWILNMLQGNHSLNSYVHFLPSLTNPAVRARKQLSMLGILVLYHQRPPVRVLIQLDLLYVLVNRLLDFLSPDKPSGIDSCLVPLKMDAPDMVVFLDSFPEHFKHLLLDFVMGQVQMSEFLVLIAGFGQAGAEKGIRLVSNFVPGEVQGFYF